jgi:hypothetical protein
MAMGEWYYAEGGEARGPLTKEELITRLDSLQGPDTLVYGPGMSAWTPAGSLGLGGSADDRDLRPPPVSARRADEIDLRHHRRRHAVRRDRARPRTRWSSPKPAR